MFYFSSVELQPCDNGSYAIDNGMHCCPNYYDNDYSLLTFSSPKEACYNDEAEICHHIPTTTCKEHTVVTGMYIPQR